MERSASKVPDGYIDAYALEGMVADTACGGGPCDGAERKAGEDLQTIKRDQIKANADQSNANQVSGLMVFDV